jgi:oligopeptide transport system ATP-binding protein
MGEANPQPKSTGADAASDNLLEIRDLRTYFKTDEGTVRAVDGVSYSVGRGECVGVVGESGSGKSVTQITVMGLIPQPPGRIESGQLVFDGKDLLELPNEEMRKIRGNEISMIWQDPMTSLNPFLKISKQLCEPLMIHQGLSRDEARAKAVKMLEKVGIPGAEDRFDQYPHQFSGGMRQRVMIAMALLCEPKLLIADEPTTALDVTIQAQILELIKDLRKDFGTSVIVITHDLGVVAGMADRIVVMYAGRVMEEAPVRDIFMRPAHPYTVGLLKSVPRLDRGKADRLIPIEGRTPDTSKPIPGCPFAERCPWKIDACLDAYPEPHMVTDQHRSHCIRAEEVYAADLGSRASAEHVADIERRARSGETFTAEEGDDE